MRYVFVLFGERVSKNRFIQIDLLNKIYNPHSLKENESYLEKAINIQTFCQHKSMTSISF